MRKKGEHIVGTPGVKRRMAVVDESGLYSLILKSSKLEAGNSGIGSLTLLYKKPFSP